MKKGMLVTVLLLSLTIVAAGVVVHNADNIYLNIDGSQQNLTYVLNNWIIMTGQVISGADESTLDFGHSSDNVIVDFHGSEESLTYVLQNLSDSCNAYSGDVCDYRSCNSGDTCDAGLCVASYSGKGCDECPAGSYTEWRFNRYCNLPAGCNYRSGNRQCNEGSMYSAERSFSFSCVY